MAIKSAWAYNNGKRTIKAAIDAANKLEKEEKERSKEKFRETLNRTRESKEINNEKIWESLKVGDTLAALNLPNVTIGKKNKSSIIDKFGVKWTKKEIFNYA